MELGLVLFIFSFISKHFLSSTLCQALLCEALVS